MILCSIQEIAVVVLHVPESVTLVGKRGRVAFTLCVHTLGFTRVVQCLPKIDLRKCYFPSVVIKSS